MKKTPLAVIIIVIAALFATADLYLNKVELKAGERPVLPTEPTKIEKEVKPVNKIQVNTVLENYQVKQQLQTNQIFDKIDLSSIKNLKIYQNQLAKIVLNEETGESINQNIIVYEIIGPTNQGNLSYLNTKLQILSQIDNQSETINETNHLGKNSLFLNNDNYKNTAFLLVQAGDHIYGFQYGKEEVAIYEDIQSIVQNLSNL